MFRLIYQGIEGLQSKPNTGKPSKLAEQQQRQLSQFIRENAVKSDGERLVGEDIVVYIASKFNITYQLNSVYNVIHTLGFSWVTSRSKHLKQCPETQKAFKKLQDGNDHSHPV